MEDLNHYVQLYQTQLKKGDIQKAYIGLIKFIMQLKADFSRDLSELFSFGNISPGYLDFTYFPFSNVFLRERKLRFGIVFNHEKLRFELWLMGQNSDIQKQYWEMLKSCTWNIHQRHMPKYSVLEVVLVDNPDFNYLEQLSQEIRQAMLQFTPKIINVLEKTDIKTE
ncbi:DUF7000 family protein [Acinetobacter puyangensis]|uniref:DUF7000 family protein n=1 Tax=Acinetobacter puyangensis TaxID=1096779 RepID=UPI003A4E1D2A